MSSRFWFAALASLGFCTLGGVAYGQTATPMATLSGGGVVTEGGVARFTIAITGADNGNGVGVGYTVTVDDTNDADFDNFPAPNQTATANISGGSGSVTFSIRVATDDDTVASEDVTVTLTRVTLTPAASLTVSDDNIVTAGTDDTADLTIVPGSSHIAVRQQRAMSLSTITNQAVERLGTNIIRDRLTRGGISRRAPDAFAVDSVNDTLTVWGAAGRSNVDGTTAADGITTIDGPAAYNGDSTAFHIGTEAWLRDNVLAGVTLGHTVGDLDWDNAASGQRGSVRTSMTSVHPYAARWLSDNASIWGSVGYGTSNIEYEEDGATASPKLTAMMMSGGFTNRSPIGDAGDLSFTVGAAWVQSDLSDATLTNGNALLGGTTTAVRLRSEWEVGHTVQLDNDGQVRLYAMAGIRKDYKDARDAIAYDAGGGVQWTDGQGLNFGVEATRQVEGSARYEEDHVSAKLSLDTVWYGTGIAPFTRMGLDTVTTGVRLTAGERLVMTVEAAVNNAERADYRNLLSGEWRF